MVETRFSTGNGVRVLILFALALVGLVLASAFMAVNVITGSADLLLLTCVQDICVFIVPAVVCAMICYRRPWRLLSVGKAPSWPALLLVLLVWASSMPALNWVVEWNKGLHLPAGMAALEQAIRQMEEAAEAMTEQMMTMNGLTDLCLAFIVVGFMAGLSEELFFRGAMMGIMRQGRANAHVVIWVVAIIFSAFHFQFLGFVPRMLLGAWLGYLLLWSRSLWVPVIAHTLNNGAVVVSSYLDKQGYIDGAVIDRLGLPPEGQFPVVAVCSVLLTALIIMSYYHFFIKKNYQICGD